MMRIRRAITRPLEHPDKLVGSVIERLPGGRRFSKQHLRNEQRARKSYQSLERFKKYCSRCLESCGKILYLCMTEMTRLHL